jgi:bacterioferritin-associated ferredoxin
MYVCVCNAVTESDIRFAVDGGVRNMRQLKRTTGCSDSCGRCEDVAVESLKQALHQKRDRILAIPVMHPA